MPIPQCDDPFVVPECFRTAEDLATCLLDFVAGHVEPLFPRCEECEAIHVFVNHGNEVPVDVGDSLSVTVLGIKPVTNSATVFTYRARLRFEVWVGGFPMLQSSLAGFIVPSREDQDNAANFMLAVGSALVRSVTIGATRGCAACTNPRFNELVPLGPRGGYAGWRIDFETDMS